MQYELLGYTLFTIAIMLILPISISIVITSILYKKSKKKYDEKVKFVIKSYWFGFLYFLVLLFINLIIGIDISDFKIRLIDYAKQYITTDSVLNTSLIYLFVPDRVIVMLGSLIVPITLLWLDVRRPNHQEEIIKNMAKKNTIENPDLIPYDYEKNIFITGKNGAGKSVAILNFVEQHIKNKEFCLILDGKGDLGKHTLYDVITKLTIKYDRPLYIINQTNPTETHSYNPFVDCNATQIKDMLINMSDWSEEHYKAQAAEYWQAMSQFLIDIKENINFQTLIKYSNPEVFAEAVADYQSILTNEDYGYYLQVIEVCGETVISAKSRFSVIAHGVGKKLFSPKNTFCLKQAFNKNAVVLVILNNLEYTDFARSVGRLVLDDIKNLLGDTARKKQEHKKFLAVYDELSVYFNEMLVDIVNKSRSLGGCNILSTQTIADMDIISEEARRQIIGNMHGFYLLKQADDKSAETLANTIGTRKSSQLTSKLDSMGKTGQGTTKIVDEYKINPNDLKNIPLEVGYWIDTLQENPIPIKTKMRYVDVSQIEAYHFKSI